ncbi:MAG: hypothetical protein HKO59_16685 [Phycisphaerales bacterium]|nr:hypothetical protein [Phycisphaerae bacterium]NNF42209.1 hypothetical protein [Phycisphaerales bacterium]NNM27587.1 hypothetical protein [Phycisphaerales bacterium]
MGDIIGRRQLLLAAAIGLSAGATALAGPVTPQPKLGEPLLGLTADELMRFSTGALDYNTALTAAEGLGPVFNKESCGNCHNSPLGGTGSQTVTRFGAIDDKEGTFDPLDMFGGSLLQSQSIDDTGVCVEVIPPEATHTTLRVTPGALGYGLIEAIPDEDIVALETGQGFGVSGHAHMVGAFEDPPGSDLRAGRFGWKAQVATILTFSADAALNEMGLTNRFLTEESDPNGVRPPAIAECDDVPDPEDGPAGGVPGAPHFIDRVTDFQRFLAAPPQTPKSGMTGEMHFDAIGCAACHHPSFTTADEAGLEDAIRNKVIRPYSDFLLHNMGLGGDGIEQGDALMDEIRTTPLWGLRNRGQFWHDGSIVGGSFEELMVLTIERHAELLSEGGTVVANWEALLDEEKASVIAFLDSLGRAEFDADGDNDVEVDDFLVFAACFGASTGGYTPDDPCAISDIDQDGDVDLDDFDSFLLAFSGDLEDCNDNGTADLADIITGASLDEDGDGIPDECVCPQDLDDSGDVGFTDLLSVLAAWGPCNECPQDLDGSGDVGFTDLLSVLAAWGPCE